jgi:putative MATE family efflux protein
MSLQTKEEILTRPVLTTFFKHTFGSLIGLMALTTANVVDGIFIGKYVGAQGLAAISLLLPYITLLVALSLMLAIGASVSIGTFMGKGDTESSSALFTQVLIVTVALNTCLALVSYIAEPVLFWLLYIPADIVPLAREYFSIIRWVFILQFPCMVMYYLVRADGYTKLATVALVVGALVNIVLDMAFVGYFDYGISGAAYATALAQGTQCLLLLMYFRDKDRVLTLSMFNKPWRRIARVVKNGLSEFTNEVSVGVLFLVINTLMVMRAGSEGVAAYSVVNYLIFLSVMVSFGIADAMHLLVSYNRGAKNNDRVSDFLSVALGTSILLGLVVSACLVFYGEVIVGVFLDLSDHQTAYFAINIMAIMWPLFLVNGCNILLSVFLTAIEKPFESAAIALCRSVVLPVSLLAVTFHFVWSVRLFGDIEPTVSFLIALPAAEWLTLCFAVFLIRKSYKSNQGLEDGFDEGQNVKL